MGDDDGAPLMLVILRVLALSFFRDRAGLVLAFVLPPIVYVVFASVFAAGANGHLDVRAGVVDQIKTGQSARLLAALKTRLDGRLQSFETPSLLSEAVLSDRIDAGVILAGDLERSPSPAVIVIHPGRKAAGEVLRASLDASANQALGAPVARRATGSRFKPAETPSLPPGVQRAYVPFAVETVLSGRDPMSIYYAGAVSILFLMFTAMQGAMTLIDERVSGLRLRLGLSLRGVGAVLGGRMAWLTLLGMVQALVLFSVAAVAYQAPLLASFGPWAVTALAAAAASAGIALALASACDTREQAQTFSTFAILILAAVGGSMAPRFLMPAALQSLGWFTPHAWVIQTYEVLLWRRALNGEVAEGWMVLFAFAAAGWIAALFLEGRRRL